MTFRVSKSDKRTEEWNMKLYSTSRAFRIQKMRKENGNGYI